MKTSLALLLFAVLAPSVVLGWLALRSAEEQRIVLERRTGELYQKETDGVAAAARDAVEGQRREFARVLRQMLAERKPAKLAGDFTAELERAWPKKGVGFALGEDGRMLCPTTRDATVRTDCQLFLWDNGAFIGNKTIATVYPVQAADFENVGKGKARMQQSPAMSKTISQSQASPAMQKEAPPQQANGATEAQQASQTLPPSDQQAIAKRLNQDAAGTGMLVMKDRTTSEETSAANVKEAARNVVPQREADAGAAASQLTWAVGDFRQLTSAGSEGVINRFVQDKLDMIFWMHPPEAPELTFGCLIEAGALRDLWASVLPAQKSAPATEERPDYVLAILDDKAHPVATLPAGASMADWKRPFVSSEIGEALPHWEAALYLAHPEQIDRSATRIRRTLVALIVAALVAIAVGGGLVMHITRRQLALAQQKTDFVSNVSHELKTPLTSIRMFSELMHEGRADPTRQSQYLRIIVLECDRLTRLIDNVLDFARLERKEKRLERRRIDLHEVIERVWEGQELHLRDRGFKTEWESTPAPYPVEGDPDALSQVLVNLIANAEKYSNGRKEITLRSWRDEGQVCVSVLDRGCGVPAGQEKKIFDPFYRVNDSLSSGIQGAGLGLTLARRFVHEHEGEIVVEPRPDGGSVFTVKLPAAAA